MVQTTIDLRSNLKGPKTGRPKNITTQQQPPPSSENMPEDKHPEFTAMGKGVVMEISGSDSSFLSDNDETSSIVEKDGSGVTTAEKLSEKSKRIKKIQIPKKKQKQVEYVSYPALRPNSENLVKNYMVSLKYRDDNGKLKTSSVCFGNNTKRKKRVVDDEEIPSDEDVSKDKFWLKHWLNKPQEERLGAYGAIRDKVGLS
jgi:hypothetical protein